MNKPNERNESAHETNHTQPALFTGEPQRPSAFHSLFLGADGLRAGWSLLLFIALFAALFSLATFLGGELHLLPPPSTRAEPAQPFSPSRMIATEAIPLLLTILVTWIMARIESRPVAVYGLGGRGKPGLFFAGLAWGIVCLSLLIVILWKAGFLVIDGILLRGNDALRYGALWLLGFFIVGLLEEYLTRGYLQFTLTRGLAGLYRMAFGARHAATLGFWTSALILSLLFGLGHGNNPGESPIGLLSAGLAALVFCLSLWRTGSLWWAIGFHTSWDWAQSFLYGVADSGAHIRFHLLSTHPQGRPLLSGGTTGPEGSIFVLLALAIIIVVILFTLHRHPDHPNAELQP